jgi:hypothetical protein
MFGRSIVSLAGVAVCSVLVVKPVAADEVGAASIEVEEPVAAGNPADDGNEGDDGREGNDGDEGLLPTWHLIEGLTFTPAMRLQVRYSYGLDPVDPDHNFQLRRFRLKGKGDIFGLAKYYAELKVDGTGFVDSPTAKMENGWIEFNRLPHTDLRIGLYDIPFSRNALTSDSKLLIMDRSVIKNAMTSVGMADNTIGALFHEIVLDGRLGYGTGIFQNNAFKKVPTWAGRLTAYLLDRGKKRGSRGSYANYRGSYIGEGRRLELGVNFGITPDAEFEDLTLTDTNFDLYAVGGDVFFNMGCFTLQAEYDWYKKSMKGGIASDIETQGGYVQAGVLLTRGTSRWVPPIELAGRYQDVDNGELLAVPPGGTVGREQRGEVGLNFYLRDHNLKIQTSYSYIDQETLGTNNLYELQLQLDF